MCNFNMHTQFAACYFHVNPYKTINALLWLKWKIFFWIFCACIMVLWYYQIMNLMRFCFCFFEWSFCFATWGRCEMFEKCAKARCIKVIRWMIKCAISVEFGRTKEKCYYPFSVIYQRKKWLCECKPKSCRIKFIKVL